MAEIEHHYAHVFRNENGVNVDVYWNSRKVVNEITPGGKPIRAVYYDSLLPVLDFDRIPLVFNVSRGKLQRLVEPYELVDTSSTPISYQNSTGIPSIADIRVRDSPDSLLVRYEQRLISTTRLADASMLDTRLVSKSRTANDMGGRGLKRPRDAMRRAVGYTAISDDEGEEEQTSKYFLHDSRGNQEPVPGPGLGNTVGAMLTSAGTALMNIRQTRSQHAVEAFANNDKRLLMAVPRYAARKFLPRTQKMSQRLMEGGDDVKWREHSRNLGSLAMTGVAVKNVYLSPTMQMWISDKITSTEVTGPIISTACQWIFDAFNTGKSFFRVIKWLIGGILVVSSGPGVVRGGIAAFRRFKEAWSNIGIKYKAFVAVITVLMGALIPTAASAVVAADLITKAVGGLATILSYGLANANTVVSVVANVQLLDQTIESVLLPIVHFLMDLRTDYIKKTIDHEQPIFDITFQENVFAPAIQGDTTRSLESVDGLIRLHGERAKWYISLMGIWAVFEPAARYLKPSLRTVMVEKVRTEYPSANFFFGDGTPPPGPPMSFPSDEPDDLRFDIDRLVADSSGFVAFQIIASGLAYARKRNAYTGTARGHLITAATTATALTVMAAAGSEVQFPDMGGRPVNWVNYNMVPNLALLTAVNHLWVSWLGDGIPLEGRTQILGSAARVCTLLGTKRENQDMGTAIAFLEGVGHYLETVKKLDQEKQDAETNGRTVPGTKFVAFTPTLSAAAKSRARNLTTAAAETLMEEEHNLMLKRATVLRNNLKLIEGLKDDLRAKLEVVEADIAQHVEIRDRQQDMEQWQIANDAIDVSELKKHRMTESLDALKQAVDYFNHSCYTADRKTMAVALESMPMNYFLLLEGSILAAIETYNAAHPGEAKLGIQKLIPAETDALLDREKRIKKEKTDRTVAKSAEELAAAVERNNEWFRSFLGKTGGLGQFVSWFINGTGNQIEALLATAGSIITEATLPWHWTPIFSSQNGKLNDPKVIEQFFTDKVTPDFLKRFWNANFAGCFSPVTPDDNLVNEDILAIDKDGTYKVTPNARNTLYVHFEEMVHHSFQFGWWTKPHEQRPNFHIQSFLLCLLAEFHSSSTGRGHYHWSPSSIMTHGIAMSLTANPNFANLYSYFFLYPDHMIPVEVQMYRNQRTQPPWKVWSKWGREMRVPGTMSEPQRLTVGAANAAVATEEGARVIAKAYGTTRTQTTTQ